METPVQVDFQGMNASERARATISTQLADLEQVFGRVTAARVVVKAPSGRHRNGGLYEINIRLVLPNGREVNVGRTATLDERHADLNFALNDAFKRARRQLSDQIDLMRGEVKAHEEPPVGKVTKLDGEGGFGFLEDGDGREVYFHQNSVVNGTFAKLEVGTRVYFVETMGAKGPQASTVKPLGKRSLL
jgi:cold shock CspA family protein/ribosome-associated translation inhibitor RaiA